MSVYHQSENVTLLHGDCIDVMRTLPDNSVDSIVTDPPYGLGFMGKEWDALPPGKEWAEECLRVLKPGGHLLAFGGTRTWHRLAVAVEDAGFEIRDSLAWLYGSGFPKSMDVSKAIDKAAGAEREVLGERSYGDGHLQRSSAPRFSGMTYANGATYQEAPRRMSTAPATDAARQWEGWGTALKPAFEPVVMGRKPFKGTVAANVLEHGTGALNIDASRIGSEPAFTNRKGQKSSGGIMNTTEGVRTTSGGAGRFPANVILDEAQAVVLDGQADASRFFYAAKAPKRERPVVDGVAHPTVKPLAIMRYLVKLVTPPGGTVLEPFAGSGTTAEACVLEGFNCIAIEREAEYLPLSEVRIERAYAAMAGAA